MSSIMVGRLNNLRESTSRNYPIEVCFKEIERGNHTVGSNPNDRDKNVSLRDETLRAREFRMDDNIGAYQVIKEGLPCYVFAGTLNDGRTLDAFSGLVVLDIDEPAIDNIDFTFESLRNHPNVYALYKTLSGEKFVILVKVDPIPNAETFKYAWFAAKNKFAWTGKADPAFSRPNQTATGAWDANIYVNHESEPLTWEIDKEAYTKAFPNNDSEDNLLSQLPEPVRLVLDDLEWKDDGWATKHLPCCLLPEGEIHENDGDDSRSNAMGIMRHQDGKGYTLNCFKCKANGRPHTKKYRETLKKSLTYESPVKDFIRMHRFIDYLDDDGKPKKYLEPVPRHIISETVTDTLIENESHIYRRGNTVGMVKDNKFQTLHAPEMQGVISKNCDLRRYTNGNWTAIDNPPKWIAEDVILNRNMSFDAIDCIVSHPFFDGEKIVYDKGTYDGVYLDDDFDVVHVDDATPDDDVDILKNLFQDYPLCNGQDLANLIALAITPFIRQSIDVSPFFFITAPRENLGKSTVGEIACYISLGKRPVVESLKSSTTEIEKSIDATLSGAPEIVFYDNANPDRQIDCGMLASVATQPYRRARRFGKNDETLEYSNKATFVYTGSNITSTRELVTRSVGIALEDWGESLENKNWTLPNILQEHLPKHFQKYQNAILRMIQRWIDVDMPKSNHTHRANIWASIIGGILDIHGLGHLFLGNTDKMKQVAGKDAIEESAAIRIMGATLGNKREAFTTQDVFKILSYTDAYFNHKSMGHNLLGSVISKGKSEGNQHSRLIRLGNYFRKHDGRKFQCGFKLVICLLYTSPSPRDS